MAKCGNQNTGSGRARVLLDAMAFFKNCRRRNMDEVRASIAPPNLDNPHVNATDRDRQEVGRPSGKAQVLEMLVPHPGGPLHGGEGAGASFLIHLPTHEIPHPYM